MPCTLHGRGAQIMVPLIMISIEVAPHVNPFVRGCCQSVPHGICKHACMLCCNLSAKHALDDGQQNLQQEFGSSQRLLK